MPSLSLLEFGMFHEPTIPCMSIIAHLLENIQTYEKLGYKRIWLTEHYDNFAAWDNPEIIIALLASKSEKIRVGAAGILLNYSNPFRVAQSFTSLNAIFHNRIDLGLARGKVGPEYLYALNKTTEGPNEEYFIHQTEELFSFLNLEHSRNHLYEKIRIKPSVREKPSTWFLGSSERSIHLAVENQSNFCLSLFHSNLPYTKTSHIPELFKELFFRKYGYPPECALAFKCYTSKKKKNIKVFQHVIDNSPWFNKDHAMVGSINEITDKLLNICELYKIDEVVIANEYVDLDEKLEIAEDFSNILIKG